MPRWGVHGSKRSQTRFLGWLTMHDESGRNDILVAVDLSRFNDSRYKHFDCGNPKTQIKFFTMELSSQMLQTFNSLKMIKFIFYKKLSTYNNLFAWGITSFYNQNQLTTTSAIRWMGLIDYDLLAIWLQARGE